MDHPVDASVEFPRDVGIQKKDPYYEAFPFAMVPSFPAALKSKIIANSPGDSFNNSLLGRKWESLIWGP